MIATRYAFASLLLLFSLPTLQAFALPISWRETRSNTIVSQCKDVTLQAAYLAEDQPGQGPGFLVTLHNLRNTPISIVDPPPLSVHWYAETNGHWLWRASSGSGGSFVNALHESGPLFAQQLGSKHENLRTVAGGTVSTWAVFSGSDTSLAYRPGCQHCTYAGEARYRAVLAYAVLLPDEARDPALLRCGLRSNPIVMPDLQPTAEHIPAH